MAPARAFMDIFIAEFDIEIIFAELQSWPRKGSKDLLEIFARQLCCLIDTHEASNGILDFLWITSIEERRDKKKS